MVWKGWPGPLEGPKLAYNDEVTGSNPVTPTTVTPTTLA
jgi:hypothetical protein